MDDPAFSMKVIQACKKEKNVRLNHWEQNNPILKPALKNGRMSLSWVHMLGIDVFPLGR